MCGGTLPIIKEENYSGLGLKRGVQYLSHDVTIEGLESVFKKKYNRFYGGLKEWLLVRDILRNINIESIKKIWA